MNRTATDQKLASIANNLFLWKNEAMRRVGVVIVEHAMTAPTLWPDRVRLSWLPDADAACIGNCYRLLVKAGIIARTGQFKRSTAKSSNGRSIFEYRVASVAKATSFLARHKVFPKVNEQPELFKAPPTRLYI